jgi:hypothetical protein
MHTNAAVHDPRSPFPLRRVCGDESVPPDLCIFLCTFCTFLRSLHILFCSLCMFLHSTGKPYVCLPIGVDLTSTDSSSYRLFDVRSIIYPSERAFLTSTRRSNLSPNHLSIPFWPSTHRYPTSLSVSLTIGQSQVQLEAEAWHLRQSSAAREQQLRDADAEVASCRQDLQRTQVCLTACLAWHLRFCSRRIGLSVRALVFCRVHRTFAVQIGLLPRALVIRLHRSICPSAHASTANCGGGVRNGHAAQMAMRHKRLCETVGVEAALLV